MDEAKRVRPLAALAVATGGGLGLLRPAPGTWGSLGATAVAVALLHLLPPAWTTPTLAALAVLAAAVGWWSCGPACRYFGEPDPGPVVIDEIAGVWLGLALFPPDVLVEHRLLLPAALLVCFRAFDIAKPWPLRLLEHLPGATGVMADDLAAGVLAGGTCHILKLLAIS